MTGVPGVRALDHTADVGIEIEAPDLPEACRRAVRGTAWLLLERTPSEDRTERNVRVEEADPARLLRALLRELLWWHDSEGLVPVDLRGVSAVREGDRPSLEATVVLSREREPPVREIKGVTLHGLVLEPRGEGWYGKVIFDV